MPSTEDSRPEEQPGYYEEPEDQATDSSMSKSVFSTPTWLADDQPKYLLQADAII